jgi:hypothetical protein
LKKIVKADESLIPDALPALVSLANHPPSRYSFDGRCRAVPGPLKALYLAHKDAVRAALKEMFEQRRPFIVRLAARGLEALLPHDKALSAFLVPELVAKLVRAKRLLDGREDEIEETLDDVRDVLVISLKADPAKVDQLIQDFLVGAAELYKVYDEVLRDRRFGEKNAVPITEAHGVAFRRLVVATSEAKTQEVRQATSTRFRASPMTLRRSLRERLTSCSAAPPSSMAS